MRPTAETPVSDLPVKKEDIEQWANREVALLLRQLRTGANAKGIERAGPVASDGAGTYVTVWTSPEMPTDATWTITADVLGTGGAERAAYLVVTTMQSVAGTISPVGSTSYPHTAETSAACNARFAYDATLRTVIVEACDEGTTAMSWTAVVMTAEGLSE